MIELSQQELEEGLTDQLIKLVIRKGTMSPCELVRGEAPLSVVECSKGYWVMESYGNFRKDKKNKLIVEPERNVIIGRARYLLKNMDSEVEMDIHREVRRLTEMTREKAKATITNAKEIMIYAGAHNGDPLERMVYYQYKKLEPEITAQREQQARLMCTDAFIKLYYKLQDLLESEDFDSLYILLFQKGLPLIASFNINTESNLEGFVKHFHASKIDSTLDGIMTKSHLYNVAKFNLSKS